MGYLLTNYWTESSSRQHRLFLFFYPSELRGKTLLLRHHAFWLKDIQNSNLKLSRKLPPFWLPFIVSEGVLQAAGEEKPSMVSANTGTCMLQYQPPERCGVGFNCAVKIMGVTNCFRIELETCSRGGEFILGAVIHGLGGHSPWGRS